MVLAVSVSSSTVTPATPAGWTLEKGQASGNMATYVFSRVATSTDHGTPVTVALTGGTAKVTAQLVAYSGTSTGDPVVVAAADTGGTDHTTPTATAASGNWVVSVWSDKQSVAHTWTPPSGPTLRSNLASGGSGDVATLLMDSGPSSGGQVGGLTATVPGASNQATMFTIVLTG
jgi:hypothetical protein